MTFPLGRGFRVLRGQAPEMRPTLQGLWEQSPQELRKNHRTESGKTAE